METVKRKRNKKCYCNTDMHIRLSEEYYNKIQSQAEELGVSNSRLIRYILEEYYNSKSYKDFIKHK